MFSVFSHNVFTSNVPTRQLCRSSCFLSNGTLGTLTFRFKPRSRHHNVSLDTAVWYVNRQRRWTDNNSTTRDDVSESGTHMTYRPWPRTPPGNKMSRKKTSKWKDGWYFISLYQGLFYSYFNQLLLLVRVLQRFQETPVTSFCPRKSYVTLIIKSVKQKLLKFVIS